MPELNRVSAWIYGRCPHTSCAAQYMWPRQRRKLAPGVCSCGRTLLATAGPFDEGCVVVYPKGRPGLTDPKLASHIDARAMRATGGE